MTAEPDPSLPHAGAPASPLEAAVRALAADPHNFELKKSLGFSLMEAGLLEEAGWIFKGLDARAPFDFAVTLGLAKVARAGGDVETALERAQEAIRLSPEETSVKLDVAFDLLTLGRTALARDAFAGLAESAGPPLKAIALLGLARAEARAGDLERARMHLAAAAEDPQRAGDAAAELLTLGFQNDAGEVLDSLIRLRPDDLELLKARARLARDLCDRDAAIKTLGHARSLAPADEETAAAFAAELHAAGRVDEGRGVLEELLDSNPSSLPALLGLSELAFGAQDFEGCLSYCRRAKEAHPDDLAPVLQATRALMELGRPDDALAMLEGPGRTRGWPEGLLARKAEILMRAGRWEEARALLQDPRSEADFLLWLFRTRLHLTLGEHAEAERLIALSPARTPFEVGFRRTVEAELAEARWDLDGARRGFEAAAASAEVAASAHAELSRIALLLCDIEGSQRHGARSMELQAGTLKSRGQLTSAASTHVGQILDELRMDPERAEALRSLKGRPPDDQIPRLLDLVRAWPGHTPTAMMLMIALRQSGRFSHEGAGGREDRPIPRRIVQYWDEVEPPPEISELMSSWRGQNPEFDVVRLHLASAGEYLRDHLGREALTGYMRAPQPAQKADVFRLAALGRDGGVWADADDLCLAPIAPLLDQDVDAIVWLEHFGSFGNNFMAARPGHPVVVRAGIQAAAAMNRRDVDIPWLSTGPGLLTRTFAEHFAEAADLDLALSRCRVLDRHETARFAMFHRFSAYKRTARHWLRASFGAKSPAAVEPSAPA